MNERDYYIFVLGYDLRQYYLSRVWEATCDEAYEYCAELYDEFRKSDYYKLEVSQYDALQLFIKEVREM